MRKKLGKGLSILLVCMLAGCSGSDLGRKFLGISISDLEKNQDRFCKEYDASYKICFDTVVRTIEELKAYVHLKNWNGKYIMGMCFDKSYPYYCIDTTEVGIFFKDLGEQKTRIEVCSYNKELARFVAKEIDKRMHMQIGKGPEGK